MPIDIKQTRRFLDRYRITSGKGFRLKDHRPGRHRRPRPRRRTDAAALLAEGTRLLSEQQDMLYAQDRWAVLCIFQAMDAAGKDGAIKHVFSRRQPAGRARHQLQGAGPGGARPRLPLAARRRRCRPAA